jgi:hypothetical protein
MIPSRGIPRRRRRGRRKCSGGERRGAGRERRKSGRGGVAGLVLLVVARLLGRVALVLGLLAVSVVVLLAG